MVGKSNMDDDSVLLKKRDDKPRKIGRHNSSQENWELFKEYYLVKTVLIIAVSIFVIWEIVNVAFFNKTAAFSVVTMGTWMETESQEAFKEQAAKDLQINEEKEFVSISSNFNAELLLPLIAAGEVDAFLMSRDSFDELSKAGFLLGLEEVEETAGEKMCFSKSEEDSEEHPYGVDVSGSKWLSANGFSEKEELIYGIACNSSHKEMAKNFLTLIK